MKPLTKKVFPNSIPIEKNGIAIPQPIINENSPLVQQVSIVNSIPPLDVTISDVDTSVSGQTSHLITSHRMPQLTTYKHSYTTTTETATASATIATLTWTANQRCWNISMGIMVTAGTYTYYRLEARFRDTAGALYKAIYRCFLKAGDNSNEINIPIDGLYMANGDTVEIHCRRSVTACTHEASVTIAVSND